MCQQKTISQSSVRISHGLNKLVTDLINRETTSRRPPQRKRKYMRLQADPRLKHNQEDLQLLAHLQRTVPILRKKYGLILKPGAQFDQAYPVAKRINTLLPHGELPPEDDGAIEFWRLKDDLRHKFEHSQYWSDDMWKRGKMAGGGGKHEKKSVLYLFFRRNSVPPSSSRSFRNATLLILHCRTMC